MDRVLLALKRQGGIEEISVDPRILKTLPKVLRQDGWRATVTLRHNRSGSFPGECCEKGLRRVQLIQVEAGDTTREHYSLAFDVGTTSIWGQVLDLNQRKVLAEASAYNGQVLYGDDVITRIVYSQKPGGLKKLQEVAVATMNLLIGELMTQARVRPEQITHMAAAGNTVMTHLLLGLDPKYIRESPYTPVASLVPPIQARELGLEVADHVSLYTFPQVASYVGGDIVAGVLGSGIYKQKPLTLYIDIGTNGEIVVGNSDWMVTAACSAGPAFEGGGIKHGLRAAPGAIEDFHLDSETFEPALQTIGMTKPRGICGSGLINIVAEFLEADVISPNGKFNTDLPDRPNSAGPRWDGIRAGLRGGNAERDRYCHHGSGYRQFNAGEGGHVRRVCDSSAGRGIVHFRFGTGGDRRGVWFFCRCGAGRDHRPAARPSPEPLFIRRQRVAFRRPPSFVLL